MKSQKVLLQDSVYAMFRPLSIARFCIGLRRVGVLLVAARPPGASWVGLAARGGVVGLGTIAAVGAPSGRAPVSPGGAWAPSATIRPPLAHSVGLWEEEENRLEPSLFWSSRTRSSRAGESLARGDDGDVSAT